MEMQTKPTPQSVRPKMLRLAVLALLLLVASACRSNGAVDSMMNAPLTAPAPGSSVGGGGTAVNLSNGPTPTLAYYYGHELVLDVRTRVLKRDVVVLFPDGRATTNTLAITNPEEVPEDKWSTYEISGNALEVHRGEYSKRYHLHVVLDHPGDDLRLEDCYSGNSSTRATFTFRTMCFNSDGRFEKSTATNIDGPFVSGSAIPPDSHGTYKIDGYRITLSFADGNETELPFAIVDEKASQIIIGGQDYFN